MTQTILVTGATGFLGSRLVRKLLQEQCNVLVLKRSHSDTRRISSVLNKVITYDIDTCDINQPFRDCKKVDAVFHAATCYGRNQEQTREIVEANLIFPLQLLSTAIQFQTTVFLNIDTALDKFINTYSLAKKQFSEWGQYFANLQKIRFVDASLEYLLGPDDNDASFTNYVISNCLNNTKSLQLTAGEQQRDFIDIDDAASALFTILKHSSSYNDFYQNYDLGSGNAISIRKFVETIHHLTHSKTHLEFGSLPYRNNELIHSRSNIEELQKLGWRPEISFEDSLQRTIEFYLKKQTTFSEAS